MELATAMFMAMQVMEAIEKRVLTTTHAASGWYGEDGRFIFELDDGTRFQILFNRCVEGWGVGAHISREGWSGGQGWSVEDEGVEGLVDCLLHYKKIEDQSERGRIYVYLKDHCVSSKPEFMFIPSYSITYNDKANSHLEIVTREEFDRRKLEAEQEWAKTYGGKE